jgi:hypothetical protein
MLFVLLSHFSGTYFGEGAAIMPLLKTICMVASPAFMLISGMMLGLLYRRDTAEFGRVRLHLFDRALFLLTVGHMVIWLAHFLRLPDTHSLLRFSWITDSVAISVLLIGATISRMPARTRAVAAVTVYGFSWLMVLAWEPHLVSSEFVKDTLIGPYGHSNIWLYNVPLLPWLAIYLAGTVLGERLAVLSLRGEKARFAGEVFRLGLGAVAMSVVLKVCFLTIRGLHIVTNTRTLAALRTTASMSFKLPPSPMYVLLFGGWALLIFATILTLEDRPLAESFIQWTALLGRNSLFVFLVQFYVYIVALEYFRLPVTAWWPLFFIATVVLITLAAREWDRNGLNRYLSMRGVAQMLKVSLWTAIPRRAWRVATGTVL